MSVEPTGCYSTEAEHNGTHKPARLWADLAPADIVETCRAYLLMAANKAISNELRVKVPASDLVQDAIVAAVMEFDKFRGNSERELLAWLTKILSYRIANAVRQFRRAKSDIRREVSIDEEAHQIELTMSGLDGTPSALAIADEEEARLQQALSELDPQDQELIRLRNWELWTFEALGRHFGLTEAGARRRWSRAIKDLNSRLSP